MAKKGGSRSTRSNSMVLDVSRNCAQAPLLPRLRPLREAGRLPVRAHSGCGRHFSAEVYSLVLCGASVPPRRRSAMPAGPVQAMAPAQPAPPEPKQVLRGFRLRELGLLLPSVVAPLLSPRAWGLSEGAGAGFLPECLARGAGCAGNCSGERC